MSARLIQHCYGYGAARVRLAAEPYRPEPPHTDLRELRTAGAALMLGGLCVLGVMRALQRDRDQEAPLHIVPFESPPPPEVIEPEPEPVPMEAEIAPPPAPIEVAIAKPAEAPPPRVRPDPVRVPEPPPVAREVARVEREVAHVAREAARVAPPAPKPAPARRVAPPTQMEAPRSLAAEPEPESTRASFRQVRAAPTSAPLRRVAIDAVHPAEAEARPEPPAPALSRQARAPVAARSRPAPSFLASAPPAAADDGSEPLRDSGTRRSTAPSAVSRVRQTKSLPTALAVPVLAAAGPSRAARSARVAEPVPVPATVSSTAPSRADRSLRGVPLASLAACRSDRLEDSLKRKLLTAVTTQDECASAAGRYRFVETKNLNAFLMWIERAPGRPEVDRCAELSLATQCLERAPK